jgi:hypothetical protein
MTSLKFSIIIGAALFIAPASANETSKPSILIDLSGGGWIHGTRIQGPIVIETPDGCRFAIKPDGDW